MRMFADSKKKDKLLDWRVQGCLCFVLCKQLQANLVNALSQEKAMCAQGRVRVLPPRPPGPMDHISHPVLHWGHLLITETILLPLGPGGEWALVCGAQPTAVHTAGLCRDWGAAYWPSTISSTLLATVNKHHILAKVSPLWHFPQIAPEPKTLQLFQSYYLTVKGPRWQWQWESRVIKATAPGGGNPLTPSQFLNMTPAHNAFTVRETRHTPVELHWFM